MELLSDWTRFPAELRGGVLCIGNFDGVHVGHAKMLSMGRDQAREWGRSFAIMTFEPHPAVILKPTLTRHPLTTLSQRQDLLAAFSPDVLLMIQPTREFLAITPDEFLQKTVRGDQKQGIGAALMVEGPTFTFGKGARGTVETLRQLGPSYGLETLIVPTQEQSLSDLTVANVSSSLIRWLIEQGRVADAGRALGRPYTLRGTVVRGAQRGREIGFPTVNLDTPQLIPAPGIYAGVATIDGHRYRAAISIGNNPTFAGQTNTIEAYLLDFSGDLYGRTIDLSFYRWLREMYAFAGVTPLVSQMNRDVDQTRRLIPLKESA